MKKQSFLVLGAALLLACGGAFAGIATFSGATGDTVVLPGVSYGPCSFELSAGAFAEVASTLEIFPAFADVPGIVELDVVTNETAGGAIAIEVSLINSLFQGNGSIVAELTSTGVALKRVKSGITTELFSQLVTPGPTRIQLELSASAITLRHHDGTNFIPVGTVNLSNVNGDDLTLNRIFGLRLKADTGGPDWNVDSLVWTGAPVPDTNGPGCSVVAVPDVNGLSESDARAALQTAGFITISVSFDNDPLSPTPGVVVSQDPAAGTLAPFGPVSIVIGGLPAITDTDQDGMDDQWEIDNFGDLTQNRWGDPDGDRFWNIREFENNTDPNNPESSVPVADYRGLLALAVLLGAVGVFAAVRMGRNAA